MENGLRTKSLVAAALRCVDAVVDGDPRRRTAGVAANTDRMLLTLSITGALDVDDVVVVVVVAVAVVVVAVIVVVVVVVGAAERAAKFIACFSQMIDCKTEARSYITQHDTIHKTLKKKKKNNERARTKSRSAIVALR